MFEQRSLKLPITLGVLMIVATVALIVGWVLAMVQSAIEQPEGRALYITYLIVGTIFLVFVLVGVILYLSLSVKSINLNRQQSNFMDSVTHELKSPIASMKLYIQTLNRRSVSDDERTNFYRFMLEDVERLDGLINHLLGAARLEKEAQDGELEHVQLDQIVNDCAQAVCLRYRVPRESIHISGEPTTVYGRRVDIDMIFRNLLDNAIKYGGDPPEVLVDFERRRDGNVVTRVRDNGPGIPLKQRRTIFGRFIRLGDELKREKPGTGLGLYIVRTLVGRLKGKVRVLDREGEAGTEFIVYLPQPKNADTA